jgi:hypothetical protein
MKHCLTGCWLLLALVLLPAASAFAQGASGDPAAAPCPHADEATHRDLLGTWKAEIEGGPERVIVLRPHPDLAESVRGTVRAAGREAEVSGDVDQGEFTLEESANGINISAVWLGDIVEGSCAREIRGTWQADGERATHTFVLRKQ